MTSRVAAIIGVLFLLGLAGCTEEEQKPRVKRPIAGDSVSPVILLGKTWKQKGPVLISARLQVQGEDESEPRLLELEDVPYEIVPRVTLTFHENGKLLQKFNDVKLTRDC